jgi:hypothetical protein
VVKYGSGGSGHAAIRIVIAVVAALALGGMIAYSKSRKTELLVAGEDSPEANPVERIAADAAETPEPAR